MLRAIRNFLSGPQADERHYMTDHQAETVALIFWLCGDATTIRGMRETLYEIAELPEALGTADDA